MKYIENENLFVCCKITTLKKVDCPRQKDFIMTEKNQTWFGIYIFYVIQQFLVSILNNTH